MAEPAKGRRTAQALSFRQAKAQVAGAVAVMSFRGAARSRYLEQRRLHMYAVQTSKMRVPTKPTRKGAAEIGLGLQDV